jgi:tetratricopeptide (TPR) repeat protein
MLKKTLPLLSFVSILFASFLLSGSAKIGIGDSRITQDSPLAAVRVSYKFESAAISDILRKISIDHGIKIRSGVEIKGLASVNLISVSLGDALAAVFKGSSYGYKLEKDAIVIESKRGGAFSINGDRIGFKRVMIAPAFVKIGEVKRIVESMRSDDSSVACDEKSGVLVLDERPEIADGIISEINKIDVMDSREAEGAQASVQTKLFVLKNVNLKEVFDGIENTLSKQGSAYPNYDLNSLIISDEMETLNKISARIAGLENANGVPVINYRFYKVPRAVLEDLAGLSYYDARDIDLADLGFSVVKNKNHFFSLLEKYLKNSASLSCDSSENAEIKVLHKSISSRISIKPYINLNSGYRVSIGLKEEAQAFNETIRYKTGNYDFEVGENDAIIARGFEKSFVDMINQTCFSDFLSYMPSIRRVNESVHRTASAGSYEAAGGQEDFILMALELSTAKTNAGLARYSFVNLLHLDSQNCYSGSGPDSFSSDMSYLNIFSAPAGAENFVQRPEPEREPETETANKAAASKTAAASKPGVENKKAIFKIKSKNNNENLIIEEHKKELKLALNLNNKANEIGGNAVNAGIKTEKTVLAEIKFHIDAGGYEQARTAAAEYLAENPSAANVRVALGSVYKEMKLYVSARNELKKAIKIDAGNSKLAENIQKLDSLIGLINEEKVKLAGKPEAVELDLYLR